jgi:hypothetical protein
MIMKEWYDFADDHSWTWMQGTALSPVNKTQETLQDPSQSLLPSPAPDLLESARLVRLSFNVLIFIVDFQIADPDKKDTVGLRLDIGEKYPPPPCGQYRLLHSILLQWRSPGTFSIGRIRFLLEKAGTFSIGET